MTEQSKNPDEIEQQRLHKEAEELASFERRVDWWRQHYGGVDSDEAAERVRQAVEHAERLPTEPPSPS